MAEPTTDETLTETTEQAPESTQQEANAAAPEATSVQEEKKDDTKSQLTKQWALMQKKDKLFRQREAALKEQESKIAELLAFKEEFEKNPIAVLKKQVGEDWFVKATDEAVGEAARAPSAAEELAEIKKQLAKEREERDQLLEKKIREIRQKEEIAAKERAAAESYLNTTKKLIESDDRFEYCRLNELKTDDIIREVQIYHQKTGKVLQPEEILVKFEEYYEKNLAKLSSAKKAQALLGQKNEPTKPQRAESGKSVMAGNFRKAVTAPVASEETAEESLDDKLLRMVEDFYKNKNRS